MAPKPLSTVETSKTSPSRQNPTYVSSLKYNARGVAGEIRCRCKLVFENTSVWDDAGTCNSCSKERR
jgi:hypothetical protein